MKFTTSLFPLLIPALAFAGELAAPMQPAPTKAVEPPRFLVLESRSDYDFTDSEAGTPSGNIWRSRLALPFYCQLSDEWSILGSLSSTYSDYETFDDDRGLATWTHTGILGLSRKWNDQWDTTVAGVFSSSRERGEGLEDSYSGGGLVDIGYRWSPTLRTSLAALYYERINGESLVVPLVGVDWDISSELHFEIKGFESRLNYKFSDNWSLYARGELDPGGGKLRERADSKIYSFTDTAYRVGLGLQWQPCKWFTMGIDGGMVYHSLTTYNEAGDEISDDSPGAAPYVGISIRSQF